MNRRDFIRASTASIFWDSVGILASPHAGSNTTSQTFVHANTKGNHWTIGNALVEREIRFNTKVGLYTSNWRHTVTGTDFAALSRSRAVYGSEFSFHIDGKLVNRSDWDLVKADVLDCIPLGKILAIHLRAKTNAVDVTVYYTVYGAHPVIQKWIAITNRETQSFTLSHLTFESVSIAPGAPDVLQASGFYNSNPTSLLFTGRVDDVAVHVRNSLTMEGFVAMNGAPGWTKRTELVGWGEGVQLMYDTDLFPFERSLKPDEVFTSAKGSIAFFVDRRGFSDPAWVLPSYTSEILTKKGKEYRQPWIYNTWEPFQREITKDITMDLIACAGRMKMDVFTIDDGWQAHYGENAINRKLFPNGLDEIQAAVQENGMRLGLWAPLAVISTDTRTYLEHPEWACRDRNNNPKFTITADGSQAVMCLASAYRKVAAERISKLIARYNLLYVKLDLTTVFNTYGESPGCYAHGHYHQSWAESLDRIYEGIQYVTDRIYRDHPHVLLDLTFELWGQKHIIDYGLLSAGDLDWLSNVNDATAGAAGPRQVRTLLYERASAIPTETMLIGNLQAESKPLEDRLATAMGSGPLFLGDLRKLTPEEQRWYGNNIQWFKNLHREIPIQEGFFSLGNYKQPGAATWDGFARLSRKGEGIIVLFKNESDFEQVNVTLPVFPDGKFCLRLAVTGDPQGVFPGEQFRRGLTLHFPQNCNVLVLEVRIV